MGQKIFLTEEQERYLVKHYKNTKNEVLMEKLGLKFATFHRIVRKLGLKKTRQFVKKVQSEGARKAAEYWKTLKETDSVKWEEQQEIRRRNLKWDDPEQPHRFKKGESNKNRLSPKRFAESMRKTHTKLDQLRKDEIMRVRLGKKQITKLRSGIVKKDDPDRSNVYKIRSYLSKRYGYLLKSEHMRHIYYDESTRRNAKMEKIYNERHKIRFISVDAMQVNTSKTIIVLPDWSDKQGGLTAI